MRLDYLRAGPGWSPFRIKYLACTIILFSVTAICAPDIQQVRFDDPRRSLKQAEKLIKKGSLTEAEKILLDVVAAAPDNSTAKLRLAFVYQKQRRLLDAYEISFAIAKAEPKNSQAFAILGATLLSAGKFAEARTFFHNSIKLNKREALAWAGLGLLDFYENRITESLQNLQEAVFYDSSQPDYFFALAQVSARSDKYTEAAEAYYRFLSISRDTDDERRARIKSLISFLRFLGHKQTLYVTRNGAQTAVQFKLTGNRPVIEVKINSSRETLNFVLDTGSGISVISDKTAKRLKINPVAKGGFATGIGGNGKFDIVYGFLRRVDIGKVEIGNVPVYIRKFHSDNDDIDGYIGLSLISKFLTTIDYGSLTFTLSAAKALDGAVVADHSVLLPLRLTSSGFLSGEVLLEGIDAPLNFIVDTGASVSVISDEVANRQGISRFVKNETMRVIGAAGIIDNVPQFLLPRVSFGTHSRKSVTAIALDLDMVNEMSGFEQAGILGGNFLRNYRVTFDFKNSKVIFVPINLEQ